MPFMLRVIAIVGWQNSFQDLVEDLVHEDSEIYDSGVC